MSNTGSHLCETCSTPYDKGQVVCSHCGRLLAHSPLPYEPSADVSLPEPQLTEEDNIAPVENEASLQVSTEREVGLQPAPPQRITLDFPLTTINGKLTRFPRGDKPWSGITYICVLLLLVLIGGTVIDIIVSPRSHSPQSTSTLTPIAVPITLPQGLGVTKFRDGQHEQYVGINNGSFSAFDVYPPRTDIMEKAQAAQSLQNNDAQTASTALNSGLAQDTNDAEAKIYLENIRALASGNYITLVVAVDFVPPFPDTSSQSALQGAYTAQKKFNDENHLVKLQLLIANSAGALQNVVLVAQQIVRVAKQQHIVGVLGWQTSRSSLDAVTILAAAHIPMVSQSASSDDLTSYSSYFFRVMPPNAVQAQVATNFARQTLNAKKAVVFFDPSDSYGSGIARDFESDFTGKGGMILPEKGHTYDGTSLVGIHFSITETDQQAFYQLIRQAIKEHPDVDIFYFTGVNPGNAIAFQNALPTTGKYAEIPVLAGDGSYVAMPGSYGRWYFTAYAYPDELSIITNNRGSDPFFNKYSTNFDPDHAHHGFYGFDRPDATAILTYDAANAFIQAAQMASQPITSQEVATILPSITFQGVSGYVALGKNGDPQNKAIIILFVEKDKPIQQNGHVQQNAHFKMLCVGGGTFYPGIDQSRFSCPS